MDLARRIATIRQKFGTPGDSEKAIARAFEEVRDEDALLIRSRFSPQRPPACRSVVGSFSGLKEMARLGVSELAYKYDFDDRIERVVDERLREREPVPVEHVEKQIEPEQVEPEQVEQVYDRPSNLVQWPPSGTVH
jgi:hypothetical protein